MSATQPLILAFVDELMFGSKIQEAVSPLNFHLELLGSVDELAGESQPEGRNDPGEPVHGRDASVFARLVERQPALIIIDLENKRFLWKKWMAILKSSPATRRIPIVAYAPHVDKDLRRTAKGHGADLVVSRGKFSQELPKIIGRLARVPDHKGLALACDEPLPPAAIKGLNLFNSREYFECHEELELAWNEDKGAGRNLYKGVLQVAVAYLQIERGNFNGAIKMMLRVKQWLDPLPPVCRGLDIGRLREDAYAVYEELQQLGRERIKEFDQTLLKPIHFEDQPPA